MPRPGSLVIDAANRERRLADDDGIADAQAERASSTSGRTSAPWFSSERVRVGWPPSSVMLP